MNRVFYVALLLILAACSKPADTPLVDAPIGSPLPAKYAGQGHNAGAFTFVPAPVTHPELSVQMQQVNLFTETETGILAGYRGDRPMNSEASCKSAAEKIDAILSSHYPATLSGGDPRYNHQSQDGKVVAGVRCAKRGELYSLTLEVADPTLERQLTSKARNQR